MSDFFPTKLLHSKIISVNRYETIVLTESTEDFVDSVDNFCNVHWREIFTSNCFGENNLKKLTTKSMRK